MAYGVLHISMDVMAALKERRAKAEAKVLRATKSLELARKELIDVEAAERVMAEITGESVEPKTIGSPVSERDKEITKLLGTSIADAKSPADLYLLYVENCGDGINLDTFRTALWRLSKKVVQGAEKKWVIKSEDGRYWRQDADTLPEDLDELLGA